MSDYRFAARGVIYKPTGEHVPPDMSNPRWRAYIDAFNSGDHPDPMEVPAPPPFDLRLFYRAQGAARTERQMQRLSNDEYIDLLRRGK